MNTETRKQLLGFIAEYGDSLTRMEAERGQQKAIAAACLAALGIEEEHFKTLAKACHKDEARKTRERLETQADLFDWVLNETDFDRADRSMLDLVREHYATLRVETLDDPTAAS